ncbi:MAG: DUF1553 domain-containing protein [Bacteroidota bacterium]
MKRFLLIGATVLAIGILWQTIRPFQSKVDFSTEVKPILNKYCIHCHGGVKQSGGVSMMTREEMLLAGDSGTPMIVPGKPNESELYLRLVHEDEEERMPFEAEALAKSDIDVLKRWIAEGAPWGEHWAFQAVEKVEVPNAKRLMSVSGEKGDWSQNELDAFVLEKMKEVQLSPSPQASPELLLRRVSLDLIGISSPENLAKKYLAEPTPKNYELLVDSLLARPEFGERWASVWMDLARYSDTKGAERDDIRNIWEYRDWLIRAFNNDMPYDQFITEQLAGDLLPNPTDAQYIATGFHRNTVTNDEGGTDNEEFRVAAVVDRVNTTWEALMSSTFACTQCHGHPYDPIRHEEYFEFLAFFNNTRDNDTFGDYPWLRKFSEEQEAKLEELIAWLKTNASPEQANRTRLFLKTWQPAYYSLQADSLVHADIYDTKYLGLRKDGIGRLEQVNLSDKNKLVFRYHAKMSEGNWTLRAGHPDGQILATVPVEQAGGWTIQSIPFQSTFDGTTDIFLKLEGVSSAFEKRPLIQFDWFHFGQTLPVVDVAEQAKYQAIYDELLHARTEHTLIMIENKMDMERSTHLWDRGNWLAPVEKVKPDVPDIFPDLPEGAPNNRLGVAMWMTDKAHPLTSRTIVNRVWSQFFGVGLVETLEDLGTQGIEPTHPGLLDYLSWQLMHKYDWSLKELMKTIVLSATYQQDSRVTSELAQNDPINTYYTRFPRVRLSAEQIRDQSLFVSGLLSSKMYGPSVMPPQPDGVWGTPYNNQSWTTSEGEDRYRRALYTYWKRSSPYPAFLTFDAAARQVCNAQRIETNTPLQALVTLNDPAFMEAAIELVLQNDMSLSVEKQIVESYKRAIGTDINEAKLKVLYALYKDMEAEYAERESEVSELLQFIDSEHHTSSVAALSIVNNAILNLDEFITKS